MSQLSLPCSTLFSSFLFHNLLLLLFFFFSKKGIYKIKSIFFKNGKTAKRQNRLGLLKDYHGRFFISSFFPGVAFETTLFRFAVLPFCRFFI